MRPTLRAEIDHNIRQLIRDKELLPGDPLPSESELAAMFKVSKPTVRESVRRLEVLGHVLVRRGVGLQVGDFDFRHVVDSLPYEYLTTGDVLLDLLEVRAVLEEGFLRRALNQYQPIHLARLQRIVERMEKESQIGEINANTDREFHLALYEPLKNSMVEQVIETFWALFENARSALALTVNVRSVDDHRRILEEIVAGREDAAVKALHSHFQPAFQDIRAEVERVQSAQ